MTMFGGRRCEEFQGTLLDFADTREIRPATAAALDHLGRCRDCVRDLEVTALAIVGLRRLYEDVRSIEPPTDAWERLRYRVVRPSTPSYALRSPILGAVMGWALVAAIGVQSVILPGVGQRTAPVPPTSRDVFEPAAHYASTGGFPTTVPRLYPDGDARTVGIIVIGDRGRRVTNA